MTAAASGGGSTYTLDELKANPPPDGVDTTRREEYLSNDEFQKVFGMDKAAFGAKPKWKRSNLKKQHGLF